MDKDERETTLQGAAIKRLMDEVEREKGEKKLLLIIGVLVAALVASVGLAIMMKAPKEQDVTRARCETDKAIALGWKETEAMKATHPGMDPKELRDKIEAMRPQFKEQARAECASK
jgi:uncharacterized membrane protein